MKYLSEKKNRKTLAAAAAVLLGTAAVPLLFENCSPSPTSGDPVTVAQIAGTAPFAYSMAVDTLAYMSCDGETAGDYTQGQLWTFKAAALGTDVGIQITPGFWSVASQLNSTQEIQEAIEASPLNNLAYPQLAIRVPSGPYGMQGYFGPASEGDGLFAGVTPIDSGSTLTDLIQQGEYAWLSEAPVATGTPGPLAAYVDFTTAPNETDANIVRQYVSKGNGYLALDFTNQTWDSQGVALPSGSQTLYGLGYQFAFEPGEVLGSGAAMSSNTTRAVQTVTEYSLSDLSNSNGDGLGWNCDIHLMIVRQSDTTLTSGPCPASAVAPPNPTVMEILQPYWRVNWQLNCAVPLSEGVCYGTNPPQINYTGSSCSTATTVNGVTYDNCPHYISICTRVP